MNERRSARQRLARILRVIALYWDDLLVIGSGCCFTCAAELAVGRAAALATMGAFLMLYAILVARSGR